MIKRLLNILQHSKMCERFDYYMLDRGTAKLSKAIYKSQKGSHPEFTKEDCDEIATNINFNTSKKIIDALNNIRY